MQVVNDYDRDVFNGGLGVISRVDLEEAALSASFDGREVTRVSGASPVSAASFFLIWLHRCNLAHAIPT